MATVLCVLYPDPVNGYPPEYARDSIPALPDAYDGGQKLPTPEHLGFTPGQLVGCVSGELGLREWLESNGHTLIVTSDKDGADSEFEKHLPEADVVISQPFWPAYLSAERIAKAPKLKLALTAGIGSDYVDLEAAMKAGITVAEVTYSNSISVAEHAMMSILNLVRNFVPPTSTPPTAAGTSPTASSAPTTSRAWTSASSPQAASGVRWPSASRPSACTCTTSTPTACRQRSSRSWA